VAEVASKTGIDALQLHISLGIPVYEIRKLAKDLEADAIVVGSLGHAVINCYRASHEIKYYIVQPAMF